MVIELNSQNLQDTIENNDIVIIDFWAPWCGPCRSFAPVFEKTAEEYPDVTFAKVNTEVEQELAGMFNIRSIPTLMIFREQIIIFAQPGALPGEALKQILDKTKELDMEQVRADILAQETQAQSANG